MINEIDDKIQSVLSAEGLDVILTVGVDNFTYVGHVVLPFASDYPDRQAVIIMTKDGGEPSYVPSNGGKLSGIKDGMER